MTNSDLDEIRENILARQGKCGALWFNKRLTWQDFEEWNPS
jgi:hypothetical protein